MAINVIGCHQGMRNWILKEVGQRRLPTEVMPIRYDRGLVLSELGNAPGAGQCVAADSRRRLKDGFAEVQAMTLARRHPAPTRGLAKLPGVSLFDPLNEM